MSIAACSVGSRVAFQRARGSVHSVYRQACNIELHDGTLLTLLARGLGNLPHGIRCALPGAADFQLWLHRGQAVAGDSLALCIAQAGVAVDLSSAERWRCRLEACALDARAAPTVRAMLLVRRLLREQAPRGGFAPLVLDGADPGSSLERAMQRRLMRTLPELDRAGRSLDPALAVKALEQLAGLGPGLTPSGDDFIVGYLAALYSRRSRESMLRPFLRELLRMLAPLAAAANLISRQFIFNALEGEFSEGLAELVSAIATRDEVRLRESVAQVVRVGHSSGADSLVGLLFGLRPSLVLGCAARPCALPVGRRSPGTSSPS
ncbi:MAG TPA: DUF2877 domain-containing protein [Burkholderiales bacterium]|nr:DUF2877 domain-containing protein [Burkholderiales bacterium]